MPEARFFWRAGCGKSARPVRRGDSGRLLVTCRPTLLAQCLADRLVEAREEVREKSVEEQLETFRFVSVDQSYTRISSREGTQSFQADAAASGSGVIPATGSDAGLESPREVACIAGQ